MPDPITDFAIVALVGGLAVMVFLEIRLMKLRRERLTPKEDFVEDRAHNALLTTQAIAGSMERRGVTSPQAAALIREGEEALAKGHHQDAMSTLERARKALSQAQDAQGSADRPQGTDEAVEEVPAVKAWQGSGDKAVALQARFAISKANKLLEARGRPAAEASMVGEAETSMSAGDFTGALGKAQKALKALGQGEGIGPSPRLSSATVQPCTGCGAPVAPGGEPCPLCGKLAPSQA